MKKLIALIIVVCLAFAFAAGCGSVESTGDAAPAEATETPAQETAAAVETSTLDYDALRALHADDDVVATVNGREVTWGEYYGWLYMNAKQIENETFEKKLLSLISNMDTINRKKPNYVPLKEQMEDYAFDE